MNDSNKNNVTKTVELDFVKLANMWFADVPNWQDSLEELQMVAGADTLLEELAKGKKVVSTTISNQPLDDASVILRKVKENTYGGGADYKVDAAGLDMNGQPVWLCGVTKFVFGAHPDAIYIKVRELQ